MKAALPLAAAALLALSLPAQAQVIIEEAPGAEGASMEPTSFLNTETARILPANLNIIGLGLGTGFPHMAGNFQYARGLGAGGELQLNVAYQMMLQPGLTGTPAPGPGGGLGYKQRVAIAGPFDIALAAYGAYYTAGTPQVGLQIGLPATTVLGPGDLTIQPRAVYQDLQTPAGSYGLQVGYRVPVGPLRLLFEGNGAWLSVAAPAFGGKIGVRWAILPNLHLDVHAGSDFQRYGTPMAYGPGIHLGHLDTNAVAGAAIRFSL
jgi:hypothetical protein